MGYKKRLNPQAKAFLDGIIARQKEARQESGSQEVFADKFKITASTLEYREGNMVDFNLILNLHTEHKYRLEWLLLGQPPKKSQ